MSGKVKIFFVFLVVVVLVVFGCSSETKYPDRDITMIIPFGQGGGTDAWGRKIADGLSKELGVNVTPNNVAGGSAGSIGVVQVWDSSHDGYVISATSETPLTIPVMTPFNKTAKDWQYFIAAGSPGMLCINADKAKDLGISNIEDLSSYANKSDLKIAGTSGGLWFALSSLLTEKQYGAWDISWISYGGSGQAITAAVSGIDADLVVASLGEVSDYLRSGDLIAIANMDKVAYENIPAITSVLPNIEQYFPLRQWLGFMIPKDSPAEVISTLESAFNKVMQTEEIKEFAKLQSAEIFDKTGKEAQEMAEKSESSLCWILYNLDKTVNDPTSVGIPK